MYIKVKIQDVKDGKISTRVGADLARILRKHGLSIYADDDIGHKLSYTDIGEYRYLLVRVFDFTREINGIIQKGRYSTPTQEEIDDIAKYIKDNGFITVGKLPVQEMI